MELGLIYKEIILLILRGAGDYVPALYFVIFAFSTGLAIDSLSILAGRKWYIPELIMSVLLGLYFALQSVLKSVFTIYFPISDMIAASHNVVSQYSEEVKNGFAFGTVNFLLIMLPVLAILILKIISGKSSRVKESIENCRIIRELYDFTVNKPFKGRTLICICGIAVAVILHIIGVSIITAGPNAPLYGNQYNFNNATDTFGLTESTILSFVRQTSEPENDEFFMEEAPEFLVSIAENDNSGEMPSEAADSTGAATEAMETASEKVSAGKPEDDTALKEPREKVYGYNIMDIDLPGDEVSGTAAKLSAYIGGLKPSRKNEYTGLFSGKNLIMICAESYCDTFIRPELTPTLWRLSHNGFYFPDFYQPSWGGSTTTGELSMLLGLDSNMGNESMQKIADNNHYFSMGNQLQRQGYFSTCFHNGSNTFYRRDLTHENLGYDSFFASGQHLDYFCGHGYPSDSEMIAGTLPFYVDKSPFSVYYMTVSGHAPYNSSNPLVSKYKARVDDVLGDEYYEKTRNYICMQMDLEEALTILVDGLEKAGIADDTVIVLTSDHYPYGLGSGAGWGNSQNYINDLVKGKSSVCWDADQTGLIIWSGCLEHENKDMVCTVDTPVFSLDILPTVSNLFGVEYDSRLLPGRDVFSDSEPLVFWNNLSWMTEKGRYNNNKHVFTPENGVVMTDEEQKQYVESVSAVVNNRIRMCTSIMKLDYYGLIFGKDVPEKRTSDVWQEIKERDALTQDTGHDGS